MQSWVTSMLTKRVISNIAYNTPEYFESIINGLLSRGIIDWAYWVYHLADTDETKDHIHFVLAPSARLDTSALRLEFMQPDPTHPSQPLCCTSKWRPTNSMDDWLLYAVHDPYYLASKGQLRRHQYTYEDLHSTDADALRNDWACINRMPYQRLQFLVDAIRDEVPFAVLVQQGVIPIAQRAQFEFQYNDLVRMFQSGVAGRFLPHEFTQADDDGVITQEEDTKENWYDHT